MKIDYFSEKKQQLFFIGVFFTNAHPIHAIFMILRQREAPLILSGFSKVLMEFYLVFIRFHMFFFGPGLDPDRTWAGSGP